MECVVLRKGTVQDLEDILALAQEQFQNGLSARGGMKEVLEDESKGVYYLAEIKGTVVAALFIVTEWCVWLGELLWWIQQALISERADNKQLLAAIYAGLVDEARKKGVSYIRVVHEDKHAPDFVKQFRENGAISTYDVYEDVLIPAET